MDQGPSGYHCLLASIAVGFKTHFHVIGDSIYISPISPEVGQFLCVGTSCISCFVASP